jgi:hypothetical protein
VERLCGREDAIESDYMKLNIVDRTWISPLVTICFGVIAVTGALMFFHVKNGPLVVLHEWVGWGFVVFGLVHVWLNWRPLFSYLKRGSAIVALVLGLALVSGLSVMGMSKQSRGGGGHAPMMVPVMRVLDANGDGIMDANECAQAGVALMRLDRNGDGQLTADELQMGRSGANGKSGH